MRVVNNDVDLSAVCFTFPIVFFFGFLVVFNYLCALCNLISFLQRVCVTIGRVPTQ